MSKWTRASEEQARVCEEKFQNGGPRVYVQEPNARPWNVRPENCLSASRIAQALDPGQTVYSRRKVPGTRSYGWFGYTEPQPGAAPAPKPQANRPDYVACLTLTDRAGRSFVVDVEVRPSLIAAALGARARENKTATACGGGVTVRFVRESIPQE